MWDLGLLDLVLLSLACGIAMLLLLLLLPLLGSSNSWLPSSASTKQCSWAPAFNRSASAATASLIALQEAGACFVLGVLSTRYRHYTGSR